MYIVFTNKIEDFLAFNRFYFNTNAAIKRSVRLIQYAITALFVLLGGTALYLDNLLWGVGMFVLGLVWFIFYPVYSRSYYLRHVEKIYRRRGIKTIDMEVTATLTDEELRLKSQVGDGLMNIHSFKRIESTKDHTFLFTAEANAIVIPRGRVVEGDYPEFIAELKRRFVAGS